MTGSLGPTYYASIEVEGTRVNAMVDPGSSATIISYEKFTEIGRRAGIPTNQLMVPDAALRDYNQQIIPVGAKVELTFRWKDKVVTTPVFVRSQHCPGETCLLGTNVVVLLGLMVPDPDMEVREGCTGGKRMSTARVCLVEATRVPGRSGVRIRGRVQGNISTTHAEGTEWIFVLQRLNR